MASTGRHRRTYRIIRAGRVAVSLACLGLLTAYTVQWLPGEWGRWVAAAQFMSLLGSGAALWVAVWLLSVVTVGRVYCSSVCPLGTVLDISARTLGRRPRRRPYGWSPPWTRLRIGVLVVDAACLVGGVAAVPSIIDPDSAYARMCRELLAPLAGTPCGAVTTGGVVIAAVSLAVVAGMGAVSGRTFCNSLCPVGAAFALAGRQPAMRMEIDTDLCTGCLRCQDVCKASCIDIVHDHVVDHARCVMCWDCAAVCPTGAITYTKGRKRLSTPLMTRTGLQGRLALKAPEPSLTEGCHSPKGH